MGKSPTTPLASLFAFDKIRLYKILEMCQFVILFLVIGIPVSAGIDRLFHTSEEEMNKKAMWRVYLEFIGLACIIVVVLFYIVKIAKAVPSIMSLLDPSFEPNTTAHYSMHVVLIVVLVELNHAFHERLVRIQKHTFV